MLVRVKGEKKEPKAEKQDSYRDFVLYLLVKYNRNVKLSKEQIIREIINTEQCLVDDAEKIFSEIEDLGLSCCRKFSGTVSYDLMGFAFLRRYLDPNDPFIVKMQSLFRMNLIFDEEINNRKKRYVQEYGVRDKWSEEVFEKYDNEETKHKTKRADSLSKIVAESLESLSDKKLVDRYLRYINVFFAEEKSQFQKILD